MADEALLVALLIGWAAVILPSALRSRTRSLHTTVGGHERAMAVLRDRPEGREIMVPREAGRIVDRPAAESGRARKSEHPVIARRRGLFLRLLALTVGTLALAVAFGGVLWPLFLVTAAVLGGYAVLLRHYKVERDRAREVVRHIDMTALRRPPRPREERRMAVGAERYAGLQVATRPDEPWEPSSGVRIRRWSS